MNTRIVHRTSWTAICTSLFISLGMSVGSTPAWSHGGEDHDDEPATPTHETEASHGMARATAHTEAFELVVELPTETNRPVLTLYLNRFANNQALAGATVEVESDTFKAKAQAVSPGVYQVPGQAFASAGAHPLTVSVQAGDDADLLNAILNTPAEQDEDHAATQPGPFDRKPWLNPWMYGGATLLALAVLIAWPRTRTNPVRQRLTQLFQKK